MTLQSMAIIAAILLGIYLISLLYAIVTPSKRPDPHDGVARGCLSFVVLGVLLLGGLLAVGVIWDHPLLIQGPFYITVYPTVMLILSLAVNRYKKWKWSRE